MRRGSRLATRRWHASTSRATSSTRSGTTPSLHARHNTPHEALNCACVLSPADEQLGGSPPGAKFSRNAAPLGPVLMSPDDRRKAPAQLLRGCLAAWLDRLD